MDYGDILNGTNFEELIGESSVDISNNGIDISAEECEEICDPDMNIVGKSGCRNSRKRKKPTENTTHRLTGLEYVTKKGKIIEKKAMKPNPCLKNNNCTKQCKTVSEADRQSIFDYFWKLSSLQKKQIYVNSCIVTRPIKRKRVRASTKRKLTNEYYIKLHGDSFRTNVCKLFFLNTLAITVRFVRTVIEKYKELEMNNFNINIERRQYNKMSPEMKANLDNFIQNLPAVASHYCRASSTRKYLSADLKNLTNVHKMYKNEQIKNKNEYVNYNKFITVFKSEYNIGIHKPKKDKCEKREK